MQLNQIVAERVNAPTLFWTKVAAGAAIVGALLAGISLFKWW